MYAKNAPDVALMRRKDSVYEMQVCALSLRLINSTDNDDSRANFVLWKPHEANRLTATGPYC